MHGSCKIPLCGSSIRALCCSSGLCSSRSHLLDCDVLHRITQRDELRKWDDAKWREKRPLESILSEGIRNWSILTLKIALRGRQQGRNTKTAAPSYSVRAARQENLSPKRAATLRRRARLPGQTAVLPSLRGAALACSVLAVRRRALYADARGRRASLACFSASAGALPPLACGRCFLLAVSDAINAWFPSQRSSCWRSLETRCANPQTRCRCCARPLWAPRRGGGALSVSGRVRLSACGDGCCPGSSVCGAPVGGVPAPSVGSLVGVPVLLAPAGGAWPRAPGALLVVAALSCLVSSCARVGLPAPVVVVSALSAGACCSACCAFLRPGAGGPRRPPAGWGVAAVAACAVAAGRLAFAPAAVKGARLPGASMVGLHARCRADRSRLGTGNDARHDGGHGLVYT